MNKRWVIIMIASVVLIAIAIPVAIVLSIHNSTYDCSFEYIKVDDFLTEIARKYTYYEASDRTVEVELNQDLINSIIKDQLNTMDLNLPEKVSVNEVLFNTKDQRLYINAKYGKLNTPISAKINVNLIDSGIEITANDLKLGNKKAPGFVKNQFPQESLKYTIRYEDLNVPQVFAVKDIEFGTGRLKVTIQLDVEKIMDMALNYRKNLLNNIDEYKNGQSVFVSTFIDNVLGTGVLSEEKVREYVEQALNNRELVNSAIHFATAEDLEKYSDVFVEGQQAVMEWSAPLQVLKYHGTIDDTFNNIVYDKELSELLAWFIPEEQIEEYVGTAQLYFAMYKDYYMQYEETKAALEEAIANIDTDAIHAFAEMLVAYAEQKEDARKFLIEQVDLIDAKMVQEAVDYAENDQGMVGELIKEVDPYYYDTVKAYVNDFDYTKALTKDYLQQVDLSALDTYTEVIRDWENFTVNIIKMLQNKKYMEVYDIFVNPYAADADKRAFVKKYLQNPDFNIANVQANVIKEWEKLISDVNEMLLENEIKIY